MSQRPRGKRPPQKPAQRTARTAPPSPPSRPEPRPFLTPDASPFRTAVERRSAKVVVFLRALPRPVPGLLVVGLVAAGLLAPPLASGVALMLVALLLAWLVFLSWPGLPTPGRALRLVVIALVAAYALVRFAGT